MKESADALLHAVQARYLDDLLPPREPLLAEMEEHAERDDVPISDPEVGRLLTLLVRTLGARRVVEVGTAIGYGALCMARGNDHVEVVTIEPDDEHRATARGYLGRAGVLHRVELLEGKGLTLLGELAGPFDLAYVDAVKTEYRQYVEKILPRLRPGGLLVLDNLLWKGRVAEPPTHEVDDNADALRDLNPWLMSHPHLLSLVLPLGDGVGLAVKGG